MRPSPIQGLLVQTCDPSPPAPTHTSHCPSRSSGAQRVTPPTCHGTGLVSLAFLARSGQFTRTEPLSTLRTGAGLGPPARRRGLTGGVGGRARVPVGTFLWPALAPPDPLASPTPQRCQVWGRGKVTKSLADERRQRGARQGAGDGRVSSVGLGGGEGAGGTLRDLPVHTLALRRGCRRDCGPRSCPGVGDDSRPHHSCVRPVLTGHIELALKAPGSHPLTLSPLKASVFVSGTSCPGENLFRFCY